MIKRQTVIDEVDILQYTVFCLKKEVSSCDSNVDSVDEYLKHIETSTNYLRTIVEELKK